MFWFDRESIIPGNFGFAISVCRLREMGRMSKSVYVRVFHDLELLRYVCSSLCDRMTIDSFNFPLGWIKYIVIVNVIVNTNTSNKPVSVYDSQ